ncbi:MAG: YdcF family protein [Candidatus Pristimantibacillus sp.]
MKKTIYVFSSVILLFVAFCAYNIWSFSDNNELVKSDAAIVLGAAVWGDSPSPVLRERINHAIWLYEQGYVDKIIFTGGKGRGDQHTESEVSKAYALQHSVSADDILIESESTITVENLENAHAIGQENGFRSYTIVSDPLHMKRSIAIGKHLGMEVYSSPTPSSAYQSTKTKLPFLLREMFFYGGYILGFR